MTICLITRTMPGALVTQALLNARGYKGVCLPAAIIKPTGASIDVKGVQALLMTSASAARAVTLTADIASLPVYAVGDATAKAARDAGFQNVISAGGDGAALAVLAADRMTTRAGALLHLRGQEVAGDVTGMLEACGFETRFVEVYHTEDHPDFRQMVTKRICEDGGYVLFHSPAGARRFALAEPKIVELRHWHAFGLSKACLIPVQNLGFAGTFAASQPDENALIDAIGMFEAQSGT